MMWQAIFFIHITSLEEYSIHYADQSYLMLSWPNSSFMYFHLLLQNELSGQLNYKKLPDFTNEENENQRDMVLRVRWGGRWEGGSKGRGYMNHVEV